VIIPNFHFQSLAQLNDSSLKQSQHLENSTTDEVVYYNLSMGHLESPSGSIDHAKLLLAVLPLFEAKANRSNCAVTKVNSKNQYQKFLSEIQNIQVNLKKTDNLERLLSQSKLIDQLYDILTCLEALVVPAVALSGDANVSLAKRCLFMRLVLGTN
jgi:hypothetical protein